MQTPSYLPVANATRINVVRLLLQETGTYAPMFLRPFQTNSDGAATQGIIARVEANRGGNINSAVLSGLTHGMLRPSAHYTGQAVIPNGFGERRIRFVMELAVNDRGMESVYFMQGYTNYLGISMTGVVDPDMQFIVNSYLRVNRSRRQGEHGVTFQDYVTECAQVVNGEVYNQMGMTDMYSIRPQDVYTGIQTNYLQDTYNRHGSESSLHSAVNTVVNAPVRSNRMNNTASNYVSSILDAYQTGRNFGEIGQSRNNIFSRAAGMVTEPTISENPFFNMLARVRGVHSTTTFSAKELTRLDPNAPNAMKFATVSTSSNHVMAHAGDTNGWKDASDETVAATVIGNAVPALLMECMMASATFMMTNACGGGRVLSSFTGEPTAVCTAPMRDFYSMFLRRVETEVMNDLSFGNQVIYDLTVDSSINGETKIWIKLNGGDQEYFIVPTFCDSVATPVATNNRDSFVGLTNDFEQLMNAVGEITDTANNTAIYTGV